MAETTWGIRFNEYPTYQHVRKGQKPEGCPDWLEAHQIHKWQKQGLVIWNSIDRKIEALSGAESLRLLGELKSFYAWKSDGVSITRLVYRVELPQTHQRKRKKGEPEPESEKPKGEDVYEEILHLPPGWKDVRLFIYKFLSLAAVCCLICRQRVAFGMGLDVFPDC